MVDNVTITIDSKTEIQTAEPHPELGLVRLYLGSIGTGRWVLIWIERSEVPRLMVAIAEAAAMGPAKKAAAVEVQTGPELAEAVPF
jgi:hypothetical protein